MNEPLQQDQRYDAIREACLHAKETDPVKLLVSIGSRDFIRIHGPEHHVLDGACLLTTLHNAGVDFDLEAALDEMIRRGSQMPGATCGQWGVCGSAASVGAALSILHGTGPLSRDQFYRDNLTLASRALAKIAAVGGPRCCKRNAILSLSAAVAFVREAYGIDLPVSEVTCGFCGRNNECIGTACPFFGG